MWLMRLKIAHLRSSYFSRYSGKYEYIESFNNISSTRQQFSECTLRVFTTGSDKLNKNMSMFEMFSKTIEVRMVMIITTKIWWQQTTQISGLCHHDYKARMESQKMEKLLAEFRISTSNVMVVPNVSRHAEAPMVEGHSQSHRYHRHHHPYLYLLISVGQTERDPSTAAQGRGP